MPRSEITIDLGALERNVTRLCAAAGSAELWAVVKADAYGHGVRDVAPVALEAGASALCVATVAEAAVLRAVVPDARVIVLGPLARGEEERARAHGVEVVISTPDVPRGLRVHAKVDTGMGRWGMTSEELTRLDPADVVGVMSHLATADDDLEFALGQIERFRELAEHFPNATRHIANSAATLRLPDARLDAVRCGIALYGLSPFGTDPALDGLEPVLSWRSEIALVRELRPGQGTGYGREFVADRPVRIGLVPVGYGDGFRRGLSGGEVLVAGRRRRILGRISMDAHAVELAEGQVGDEVTLVGDGLLLEEHARRLGTITYELACGICHDEGRAQRRTLRGPPHP